MDLYLSPFALFGVQTTCTWISYVLIAWWFVWPWCKRCSLRDALLPLLMVHGFRHLGMTSLAPGMTGPSFPQSLAVAIAWGDFTAYALAIVAAVAVYRRSRAALGLVWLMNIVGCADLGINTARAILAHTTGDVLGPLWTILNFYVPLAWVASLVMIGQMLTRRGEPLSGA